MFFQIDGATGMAHWKIDYLRKPWNRTFPKIPFPSKLDRFFIQKKVFQKFWPFWIHERGHIWRKNINFLSRLPNFSFDPFVYRSNLRTTKIYRIFSALKCIYLELSTGKNRVSEGVLVKIEQKSPDKNFQKISKIWRKIIFFFQNRKIFFFEIDSELSETRFKPKILKSVLHRGSWR